MKLKKKDDDEEKMAFLAKGPSMYYVSTFLDFFVPSTHYVSINTLLDVRKYYHFLNLPPSPFADVIY